MLEEEQRDEDGEEESDGEVLVERSHRGPADPETGDGVYGEVAVLGDVQRSSCNHSRREGDAGRGNNQDPIGSDQRGRVTGHHSQAQQELPRRGSTGAPDTQRLIGREPPVGLIPARPTFTFWQKDS